MNDNIFESESIGKAYFTLALPVVFSMVVSIVYNITDTYYIAQTGNIDLVAGISLCAPLFTLLMAFGNIFGQGGSSLISRLLGQKDYEKLHIVSAFCFYGAIFVGFIVSCVMLFFRNQLLAILGVNESNLVYAKAYYTIMAYGAPLVTLTYIHTNLLRAEGLSKESMIASVGGSIVNILLDPVLIFKLDLGVQGAALATLLGYVFNVGFCLYIAFKKSKAISVKPLFLKIKSDEIRSVIGVGTSSALTNIMSSFALVLVNNSLNSFDSESVGVMGIVSKVNLIVFLVIVGFSFGGAPLIGYYYGSNNSAKLEQLKKFVLRFLVTVATVMSLILVIFAGPVLTMFNLEADLLSLAKLMLRAQMSGMIFIAIIQFASINFQATGKAVPALALALARQGYIFVVVLLIAKNVLGLNGVIFAQPVSDLLTALLAILLYRLIK